jgi:hypothetical protein
VYSLHRPSKATRTDSVVLSFSEEDARGVVMPHDDALVVTLTVANHGIHRILVDNGSSADILYWPAFQQMGMDRERIKPFASPLVGFGGEVVFPMGIIPLPVTAGTAPQLATVMVDFLVIDRPSTYNAIVGRPALNKLKAATSTYHLMMKFPTEEGVGIVRGDQLAARKCYNTSMKKVSDSTTLTVASVHEVKGEPAEPLEEVSIGEGRVLQIGTCLEKEVREGLVKFLQRNVEVFAWSHEDMPGISPEFHEGAKHVDCFPEVLHQKDPTRGQRKADHLARMASAETEESDENERVIQILRRPSIFEKASDAPQISSIEEASDWRQEIFSYLQDGTLPSEKKSAMQLRMKAGRFTILNGLLYKMGFTLSLLKCISTEEGNYVLREIHEGICGSHSGARVLAHKAIRAGFYWPNMYKDSTEIVRYCDKCQRFANVTKQPPEELTAISSPWPFS